MDKTRTKFAVAKAKYEIIYARRSFVIARKNSFQFNRRYRMIYQNHDSHYIIVLVLSIRDGIEFKIQNCIIIWALT